MPRKTQQNIITSTELLEQVHPQNKELKREFLMYCRTTKKSATTLKEYESNLNIFFCWNVMHNQNVPFPELTKRGLIAYQNFLIFENGNSPARVRGLKAALSSLSNYIENILDEEKEYKNFRSIIKKVPNPMNQLVREKTVFTPEDMVKLLERLEAKGKYQQACAVALAMCSGSRKSELTRFKVSFFKPEYIISGFLYKTPEKIKTKGRGDGKMLAKYVMCQPFQKYLDLWLQERERLGVKGDWLFVTKKYNDKDETRYEQINVNTFNSWAETYSRFLKLDFYWHSLRHYFTTTMSRMGLPDGVIQNIVGWDSADMVGVYKDIPFDEEIGSYFINGKINEEKIAQSNPLKGK